jgi:hydrogenase 3 maturation protease
MAVVDAGDRPEDFTGEIALARPDTVLIADAVEMGTRPGSVAVLEAEDIRDGACDTHRASLAALMRYLELSTRARVLLLAIQPSALGGTPDLSAPVAAAVERLGEVLGQQAAGAPREGHILQGGEPWTTSSGS